MITFNPESGHFYFIDGSTFGPPLSTGPGPSACSLRLRSVMTRAAAAEKYPPG